MTEQRVAWESTIKNAAQRFHFINPFSYKDALTVQVLIHIGSGVGVDVEPGLSGINTRQPGPRRTLNTDSNPRLQDAIAGNDYALLGIDNRLIQWVRQCSHH